MLFIVHNVPFSRFMPLLKQNETNFLRPNHPSVCLAAGTYSYTPHATLDSFKVYAYSCE